MALPDHILQEDGGKIVLEEGTNHLIQEESTSAVDSSVTTVTANTRQRTFVIQRLNNKRPVRNRRARR